MTIRKADKTDIPVIRTLAHAIWPGTYGPILSKAQIGYMIGRFYDPAELEKQFDENHTFLIAGVNSEPIAFTSYCLADQAGVYKINKLYVHPMMHKKGIGKKLLDAIIEDITSKGAGTVELNVNRNNPARNFYERCGFTIIREEDIDIGEGYFMNDYIMQMDLPDKVR